MGVEEGIGWRDVGITRKPETREEVILGIQGNGSYTCKNTESTAYIHTSKLSSLKWVEDWL